MAISASRLPSSVVDLRLNVPEQLWVLAEGVLIHCELNSFAFNQLFSFSSDKDKLKELTAGSDEKTQRSPAGNRTQDRANSRHTL